MYMYTNFCCGLFAHYPTSNEVLSNCEVSHVTKHPRFSPFLPMLVPAGHSLGTRLVYYMNICKMSVRWSQWEFWLKTNHSDIHDNTHKPYLISFWIGRVLCIHCPPNVLQQLPDEAIVVTSADHWLQEKPQATETSYTNQREEEGGAPFTRNLSLACFLTLKVNDWMSHTQVYLLAYSLLT